MTKIQNGGYIAVAYSPTFVVLSIFDRILVFEQTRYWSAFADRIPKVHISNDEEGSKEIELSDDPFDCMRLNVENVPCIVTLCKVSSPNKTHTRKVWLQKQRPDFLHFILVGVRWATGTWWTPLCKRRRVPWPASSFPSHTRERSPVWGRWAEVAWTLRASSKWLKWVIAACLNSYVCSGNH